MNTLKIASGIYITMESKTNSRLYKQIPDVNSIEDFSNHFNKTYFWAKNVLNYKVIDNKLQRHDIEQMKYLVENITNKREFIILLGYFIQPRRYLHDILEASGQNSGNDHFIIQHLMTLYKELKRDSNYKMNNELKKLQYLQYNKLDAQEEDLFKSYKTKLERMLA